METCKLLSVLPGPIVAIALYLFFRFKFPKGKFELIHKTFLLGLLGIIPMLFMYKMVQLIHFNLHSINRTLFYAFVLTGGVYELWKFIILRFVVFKSKLVKSTIDMIIYSVFIGAGFTTAFGVYSLYFTPGYIDMFLSTLTLGPAFILIAVIMGYFVGKSLRHEASFIDQMTALFLAVIFEGIYRFCITTTDDTLLYMVLIGTFLIAGTLFWISLKEPNDSK